LCIYAFEGKYYIGTYGGGIYVLNPSTLTLSDFETADLKLTPFLKGHVFSIKSDDKGDLWMATSMGLYCYRDGQQIRHYTTENSKLPGDNVYDICFDSTRKGWICTENGLCLWDPSTNSLKSDVFPEGFIHKDKIRTVYEDSDHELYFLPDKGAVFISDLSMNHFRRMQSGTPLDGKDAMFIVEDYEGWLWIGTNLGLYRYDKKNNFVPYNFVDGLPSSIFITCFPVIDEEGTMWFGNSKGLIYLTSEQNGRKAKWHYPIAITDVLVNGKQSVYAKMSRENNVYKIKLEAEQRNLTIRFSGFTYSEPTYMSYKSKMEGIDGDWQLLSGQSEITYYDLSSGNYQFRIHRVDDPKSEICLMVTVAPRFNAVMWSMTVLLMLIITLVYIYYRRRMKRTNLIQSKAKQQSVIEEKYRKSNVSEEECRRLTGELELLMQRERLYVNPNLKIVDLAAILNVSTYTLSYLFNQYLDKNYYDYLNDYRIEEFKRLVDKDEYSKYTLTALAELCGFSSRTSFFRYFKKVVGITPNEYIRSIGKANEE
jgi:AraC-like DNA-binding protein/streptogramin lyase